jgi:hypothetical protein
VSLRLIAVSVILMGVGFVVPAPILAQAVYGSIFGTITDLSGAAIVGAKVTITSIQKGTEFHATSNTAGNYEVTHLIPDQYDLRAEAPRFKIFESSRIPVFADQAIHIDVRFQVGGAREIVTVSAKDVPLLKTDRPDMATNFDEKAVGLLPLFNRNFTALQLLTPGAQKFIWQHARSENPQGGLQITISGQHFGGTSFQLDGTDNYDPILGIIVINPTLESVTQTKITSQNYDAEFGQALSGVVSTQTKSGTNEWHGSAFEFRRTGWGQARNPFTELPHTPRPPIKWNQFGGSLGGPVRRNKLFIFGDYQGTRRSDGASVRLNVPSALLRATCLDLATPYCDLSDYPGPIFDPLTGEQFTGMGNCTMNCIPKSTPGGSQVSPQALKILAMLPGPNVPGAGFTQNFINGGADSFDDDAFDVRLDGNLSKLKVFGRYSLADFRIDAVGAFGPIVGGVGLSSDGFAGQSRSRNHSVAAGFDYPVSQTLLTDFRFGFYRYHVNVLPTGLGKTPAQDAGIPGLNLPGNIFTSGMPAFIINGFGGDDVSFGFNLEINNCHCPVLQTEQQFQWVNNWTKSLGNHLYKWGMDFRYAQNLRVPSRPPRSGELVFDPAITQGPTGGGLGLASFLLGEVSMFNRTVSQVFDVGERQRRWFFYGQDTFRITPKLTLDYGLRWEIYFPQSVTGKGKGGWVDLDTGLVNVAGYGGTNLQGNVKNAFHNFAPRLGIADQLTPKTALRMGYGRSFDLGVFGQMFGHTVTQNPPVLVVQSLNPPSITTPVFNLAQGPPEVGTCSGALTQSCFPVVPSSGQFPLPNEVVPFVIPKKVRPPTVDQWNVTVQRVITPSMSLELAYVGDKGTHVGVGSGIGSNPNQPTLVGFPTLSQNERKPFFRKFGWTQGIFNIGSDASNNYNALQVKMEKRFTAAYALLAHYTWAKGLGYDFDYFTIDPKLNYGVNDYDRKHAVVVTNLLELPFGLGKPFLGNVNRTIDRLVGGWAISGTTLWYSGLPFSPDYSSCSADRDTGPCRPNIVGPIEIHSGSRAAYFTTTSGIPLAPHGEPGDTIGPWQRPAVATFGSAGRNSLRGPGFFQTDISVSKQIPLKEGVSLQFRTDIYNVFNVVNLSIPESCVDCADGGTITGTAGGQRQLMFAVRLEF